MRKCSAPQRLLLTGGLLLLLAAAAWIARRRVKHRGQRGFLAAVAVLSLLATAPTIATGGYFAWFYWRPQPDSAQADLFQGIHYTRDVRRTPRPLVIHVVRIDLDAPGVEFLVTPPLPANAAGTLAMKTSVFLRQYDLQVAVNANGFGPTWTRGPFDYYPHAGDPVVLSGISVSNGHVSSEGGDGHRSLLYLRIGPRNEVAIGRNRHFDMASLKGVNAISGTDPAWGSGKRILAPQMAAAIGSTSRTLLLIAIDGYQPGYSEGATLDEMGGVIEEYGGRDAIYLDGGDSTTMVAEGRGGRPRTLNAPVFAGIAGRQAAVGNHLGIRAIPIPGRSF